MKKIIKTYWQLLIFPFVYIPYFVLNGTVIVKWLGCGCPIIDENGDMISNSFNANDFSLIFWSIIALTVIIISFINMRNITKWYYKLIYISFMVVGSIFIALELYGSMVWG